jgi:hypothetical protein
MGELFSGLEGSEAMRNYGFSVREEGEGNVIEIYEVLGAIKQF